MRNKEGKWAEKDTRVRKDLTAQWLIDFAYVPAFAAPLNPSTFLPIATGTRSHILKEIPKHPAFLTTDHSPLTN